MLSFSSFYFIERQLRRTLDRVQPTLPLKLELVSSVREIYLSYLQRKIENLNGLELGGKTSTLMLKEKPCLRLYQKPHFCLLLVLLAALLRFLDSVEGDFAGGRSTTGSTAYIFLFPDYTTFTLKRNIRSS
ncbi:hypothetical protein CEXT_273031 [Caerostris extrusa]|uniref:Uncharacterized protein n=1 Tax=Caerostris extrusa TaxID=172846 RepID=A0AAV4P4H7_CAEEX|nr:hypothetical protein CEXT_273031 [Caerostris extrusa]